MITRSRLTECEIAYGDRVRDSIDQSCEANGVNLRCLLLRQAVKETPRFERKDTSSFTNLLGSESCVSIDTIAWRRVSSCTEEYVAALRLGSHPFSST